jgi:glycosyltransferase involved in cell wall biosynthesis
MQGGAASPEVSVVVPTRDRPRSLARCLAALDRQSLRNLEVVVVDDGSSSRREVAKVVERTARARLMRGSGRGPAAARNMGARHARSPVICFTDDDCEPVSEWAERLASALAQGVAAAAGPTTAAESAGSLVVASQLISNSLLKHTLNASKRRVSFAPSSNLACRAEVLALVPFDESYPRAAGEDRDWCARLLGLRHEIAFEPTAVVKHRPRLSLLSFCWQQMRYGRASQRFRHRPGPGRSLRPSRFYVRLVISGFHERPTVGLAVGLAQLATALGAALEALDRGLRSRWLRS